MGEPAGTDSAVNHVFCCFTEERQSPFLQITCKSISSCTPIKCRRLHGVFNTMDVNTTNNARTLNAFSAYVVFFIRLKREERIWENYVRPINTNIVPMHGLKGKVSNKIFGSRFGCLSFSHLVL